MSRIGAIEAGGTKMVLAVGTEDGDILERTAFPTTDPASSIARMVEWFSGRSIDALGVGAFGPTCVNPSDASFGYVLETPKVAWRHVDFRGALAADLNVPVGYDTDVNAACLGEATYGAGKGLDCLVYVTVGTGIGAGVLVDGKLLHGMLHAEAGHIPVTRMEGDGLPSVCPYHPSCLEGLASGPSIESRWGRPAADLEGRDDVWELEAAYLAQGLATYVLCYAPRRIVLGGGVMSQLQLFPLIRAGMSSILAGYVRTPEIEDLDTYIVPSGCAGDQGILGALELGRRALRGD
ncbi:ROK family protein [Olsenella massiliensis]|uniref:ROK family protein n=1 Tax=Olsenella massiliensis TaxID=1622075 RepID=UPI000AACBA47